VPAVATVRFLLHERGGNPIFFTQIVIEHLSDAIWQGTHAVGAKTQRPSAAAEAQFCAGKVVTL
jgi:hypothetical protein